MAVVGQDLFVVIRNSRELPVLTDISTWNPQLAAPTWRKFLIRLAIKKSYLARRVRGMDASNQYLTPWRTPN